jgi:hypothetical protein
VAAENAPLLSRIGGAVNLAVEDAVVLAQRGDEDGHADLRR